VLPALKALAEGAGKEAPILDESTIKTLAAESDNFKKFWANIKGGAGGATGLLASTHIALGNLVDDMMALAKVPVNRLFNKDLTWAEQRQQENQAYTGRRARKEGLRNPNGTMVFDRNAAVGTMPDTGVRGTLDTDELIETRQKLSRAEDMRERARVAGLSREERITELLKEQEQIALRIKEVRYGREYGSMMLQQAENELELTRLLNAKVPKDPKEKAAKIFQESGDSLSRVGNFLGTGKSMIEDIAGRQLTVLQQIAENTKPSPVSSDVTYWPTD
jgi:hypothetical protein